MCSGTSTFTGVRKAGALVCFFLVAVSPILKAFPSRPPIFRSTSRDELDFLLGTQAMDSPSVSDSYFIVEQGQKKGPIDVSGLESMRRQGSFFEDTPVWKDGMADWEPALTVIPQVFAASLAPVSETSALEPGQEVTLTLAHPKWRFLAGVIDLVILTCIMFLIALTVVGAAADFFIPLLYTTLFLSSEWQGTIGMKACGLKIVDYSGCKISGGRALLRTICAEVLGIFTLGISYLVLFFSERRQTVHDMIVKTLVIKVEK